MLPERQPFLMLHPSFNLGIFPIQICQNSASDSGLTIEDISSKGIFGGILLQEKFKPIC